MPIYYLLTIAVCIMIALSSQLAAAVALRWPDVSIRPRHAGPSRTAATAKRTRSSWTILDVVPLALLVGFAATRIDVGTDYQQYVRIYSALVPQDWRNELGAGAQEYGFTALSLLVKQYTESPKLLFFIASVFTVLPVYATIKKKARIPWLSFALYILLAFYVAPFNTIRQGLAASLNIWSTTFMSGRRWIAFLAINAVAVTLHASVVIAVAVELVIVLRMWKPKIRLIVIAVVAALAMVEVLLHSGLLDGLLNSLNPRYDTYLAIDQLNGEVQAAGIGTYLQIVFRIGLLLFALWLLRSRAPTRGADDIARWFAFATVGLASLIVGTQVVAVSRLDIYFGFFVVLLVPNLLADRQERTVPTMVLVAAAAVYFGLYLSRYAGLLPYHSYL